MKKAIYPLLLLGTFCVSLIHGQSLGEWSLENNVNSTFESSHVIAEKLARGNGISDFDFGAARASANAWETGPEFTPVDYAEICLSPKDGYDLLVNGLNFSEQRSADGIRTFELRWSLDGFQTSTLIATETVPDDPDARPRSYGSSDINVRVCEGETLCIRFYGAEAENYLGKWSLADIAVIGSESPVCTPPATLPSGFILDNVSSNSMDLSWMTNTDNTVILARKGQAVTTTLCSGNIYTANTTFGMGDFVGDNTYVVYNGPDEMVTVDGLEELETYHFLAIGYNAADKCYQKTGLPQTSGMTICGTTPVDVSGLTGSPVDEIVTLAWNNPNCFDEVLVVASTASITGNPTSTDGTAYTADANYGDGSDSGPDFSAPEFPVFKGTGNTVAVTGLTVNTPYYFKVFARKGTAWSAGAEISFTPLEGCASLGGDVVFINELHYQNFQEDIDEGVEIVGPAGIDLSNYELYFYDNSGNLDDDFLPGGVFRFYGVIDDEGQGYGAMWFTIPDIKEPAGIALYNEVTGQVLEFLSFRGNDIAANEGVALGLRSTCLGLQENNMGTQCTVNETPSTPINYSLQRIGDGNCPGDLEWGDAMPSSRGIINDLQQVLPIELIYFRGEAVAERVLLSWQTLSEQNNDYMAVEHSTDAKSFREIGQRKGAGTTTEPQSYQLWHDSPRPGVNYYRLQQVDFDGTISYHGIVAVNYKGSDKELRLYPTPTTGLLTVELPEAREERTELAIYDMQGRILQRILLESSSQRKEISVEELPPGPYFLQWRSGTGEVLNRRFVKY